MSDDLVEHTDDRGCVCGPAVVTVAQHDAESVVVLHRSLDNRPGVMLTVDPSGRILLGQFQPQSDGLQHQMEIRPDERITLVVPRPQPDDDIPSDLQIAVAQAIRDSNGTDQASDWWERWPTTIPAHFYAVAAIRTIREWEGKPDARS